MPSQPDTSAVRGRAITVALVDDEYLIRRRLPRRLWLAGLTSSVRPPTHRTPSGWWSICARMSC